MQVLDFGKGICLKGHARWNNAMPLSALLVATPLPTRQGAPPFMRANMQAHVRGGTVCVGRALVCQLSRGDLGPLWAPKTSSFDDKPTCGSNVLEGASFARGQGGGLRRGRCPQSNADTPKPLAHTRITVFMRCWVGIRRGNVLSQAQLLYSACGLYGAKIGWALSGPYWHTD